jgi:prepilin-type processing-associated H-X9-DG protein
MKLNSSNRTNRAMTVFEVLIVVTCVVVAAAMVLPILASLNRRSSKINCVSNVKQVSLALRIWEGDNGNLYPMSVSVTNGGAMELIQTGNPIGCFRCASNEMSTTKIFVCPNDTARTFATNFVDLNGSHISYFLSADVSNDSNPNMILIGDDNLSIDGNRVASGLLSLKSNTVVSWFGSRHEGNGNLGMADGSVSQVSPDDLQQSLRGTGLATNRIAIP